MYVSPSVFYMERLIHKIIPKNGKTEARKISLNLYINDIPSLLEDTRNDIGREPTPMSANTP